MQMSNEGEIDVGCFVYNGTKALQRERCFVEFKTETQHTGISKPNKVGATDSPTQWMKEVFKRRSIHTNRRYLEQIILKRHNLWAII